ncbi:MAG: hypothetical protein AAF664_17880 [Planctomycetota bacterium]
MSERWLYLGGGRGWHYKQTRDALARHGCELTHAKYESLAVHIDANRVVLQCQCEAQSSVTESKPGVTSKGLEGVTNLSEFAGVLSRTMPAGNLEQITTRLAVLHELNASGSGPLIVNSPSTLEWAIDKLTTLAIVARLGFAVPDTHVVQNRAEAMRAFDTFGGDVVVKPLFGGEGRGIMRIGDRELAWTAFAALDELQRVFYVQRFIPKIEREIRVLQIGARQIFVSRHNDGDFRSNASQGGRVHTVEHVPAEWATMADEIAREMNLFFGSIDFALDQHGLPTVIEVNAVPGWKYTQAVREESIADILADELMKLGSASNRGHVCL